VTTGAVETERIGAERWIILLGLITAAIMEVLDTTIVNVALPQMAGNLGATQQEISWVMREASMLSHNDAWLLLLLSILVVAPVIFLLGKTRSRPGAAVDAH
jgi:MFS family permease